MSKKTELQSFHVLNHSKCMMAAFQNFRQDETMLDVTLACKGVSLKAHKIVLSACSPYFKTLFADNPCKHPIVILKDVDFVDLKAIVDFMYRGELSVPRERLVSTLKTAEELQVRGLKSSESTRKNYEKLYKKVCEKQNQKKKRKKQHQVSSESENNSGSLSNDSDQESGQSDDSFRDAFAESFAHNSPPSVKEDLKKTEIKQVFNQAKEIRPVVLHVGEPCTTTDDNMRGSDVDVALSESCVEENKSFVDLENDLISTVGNPASESSIPVKRTSFSSPFDSFITCPEKSENSVLDASLEVGQSDIQDSTPVTDITLVPETKIPGCSKDRSSPISQLEAPVSETTNHSKEAVSSTQIKARGSTIGFECPLCERVFTSRAVLLRHEVSIHKVTNSNLPFKCHYCKFSFKKGSHLKKHMFSHSKKSPYKCSVCSKGFKTERHLQQHSCVHTDEKSYSCDTCSSEFKHLRSLITHRRIHRQHTPFMCRYCCKRFFRGCDLIQHEKTCQGKLKPSRFKILNVKNLTET